MSETQSFIEITAHIDEYGYIHTIKEHESPKLEFEEYELNGKKIMTSALKPLESSTVFYCHDDNFAIDPRKEVTLFINTIIEDSKGETTVIAETETGFIREVEASKFERGKEVETTIKMNVESYKKEVNGKVIYNIDKNNNIQEINGVDQYEKIRQYLV